jgi:hypothetical protein
MLRGLLTASLLLASLVAFPLLGNAQYMYVDANGDGIHTAADQLNASGATSLDIWLDTTHDRDGSPQSCNSHSGASTSGGPLDLFSFTIVLQSTGGTVSWGSFSAANVSFTVDGTDLADAHDTEFNRSLPLGTVIPPGLVKLGTIPVTVASGAPSIHFGTSTPLDPFGFGTGFGTDCEANAFTNTYVLASPGDPAGDWFDTDGAAAPVSSNIAPSLSVPSTATAAAGSLTTLDATATDPDAGDVLTITETGAPASLTLSASPGPSPATATLGGTPTFVEAASSPYSIHWAVNDGAGGSASATTSLTLTRTDTAPVVSAPATALFAETVASDFGVGASDPEGDPIASFTASPMPSGATFTPSAFNTSGDFEWTPASGQAGTYPVTFTATSGSPALSASAMTSVVVGPPDHRPVVTAVPLTVTVNEGGHVSVTVTASDPDGDPLASLTAKGTQNTALPTGATFTVDGSFTSGLFLWDPTLSQAGVYHIDLEATSVGSLGEQISVATVLVINVKNVNQPPVVTAPATQSVNEGSHLSYSVSATDPDGNHVALGAPGLPLGAGFTDHGNNTGTFDWTPGYGQAGTYTVTIAGNDGLGGVATAATAISVSNVNRAPVSNPGGPYSGLTNVPVNFDGSGSSDPDGDALSTMWMFGDTSTGTGAMPSHTYTAGGTYTVTLTVTDAGVPPLSSSAATTAAITSVFVPRIYVLGAYTTIKLNSGKPTWCAQIEPVSGNFAISDVRTSTLVLKYGASRISGDNSKTALGGDKDGNGIAEIGACFAKPALRTLFAGLPSGKTRVTLTIEADLVSGGRIQGSVDVDVQKSGSGSGFDASVSPNPLNPQATLTFSMGQPGSVRVALYDLSGRLVRNLMQESFASAGDHDVTIDGRDENGEKLSSGVYFYNIKTADGSVSGRVTILK